MQHVTLKDDENKDFSEKMAFVLIDLTKFAAQTDFKQLPGLKEKWCYTIKNMGRMKDGDIPVSDTAFWELYEECKLSKLSDMEKQEYEKSILEYEDVKDAIEYNRQLSREEGFNDGFNDGFEKGVEKGMEKGMEDAIRQMVVAMLEKGIPIATIVEITGMDEEQIKLVKK